MTRWIRRVLVGGSLAFGLSAATGLLFAAPAASQGFSGCSATFDGVEIGRYSTPKTAKRVDENSTLAVTGTALDLFFSPGESRDLAYLVKLELAGASWTVDSGTSSQQTWAGSVKVKDYATRGAGIYKVVAVTKSNAGTECFGRAYVKVKSSGPLSTTAGQVAGGAGLLGAAGLAVAGARAGREITPEAVGEGVTDFLEEQGGPPPETPLADEQAAARAELDRRHDAELHLLGFCGAMTLLAAAATIRAVASDAVHHLATSIGGWWR
jgi:hypothetical protein